MPSSLIHEVAQYCWSNNFLDVFHKFFRDYAEDFIDAPEICGGEHDLKYYSLFQKYLAIYEDTLETYLKTLNTTIEDFYSEVRNVTEEGTDAYLNQFVRCLLASADYESFYRVMHKEGKKKALELKTGGPTVKVTLAAEAKGEAKTTSAAEYGGSKVGADDDDDADFKSEGKSSYK
jgi:hypothetical protein